MYAQSHVGSVGANMFAYCCNNPLTFSDDSGEVIETAIDIVTLGASIAAYAANPTDVWALIGLAGDIVDLLPGVTCVGEAAKALGAAAKAADAVGDTATAKKMVDATIKLTQKIAEDVLPKGNYTVYVSYGVDGVVDYVGMTNDFVRRSGEWLPEGRVIHEKIEKLDKISARWCEQVLIDSFGIGKHGGMLDNAINSISKRNSKYALIEKFYH